MVWKRSKIKEIDYEYPSGVTRLILGKGEVFVEAGVGMNALVEAFDAKENSGVECLIDKEIIYCTDPSNVIEGFFPVREWKGPKIKRNGEIECELPTAADEILSIVREINEKALYPLDLKEAIIGYVERSGMQPLVLLDKARCYRILIDRGGMTYKEAEKYFYNNILGTWVGEGTPCFASLFSTEGLY